MDRDKKRCVAFRLFYWYLWIATKIGSLRFAVFLAVLAFDVFSWFRRLISAPIVNNDLRHFRQNMVSVCRLVFGKSTVSATKIVTLNLLFVDLCQKIDRQASAM